MGEPFSAKLTFVLKSLSLSRARLAAELGVNKSVVARWVSGATSPSENNLARLSALVARSAPGFTVLDWERDAAGLAELLGVSRNVPSAAAHLKSGIALHFGDEIRAATRLRGPSYEGFYQSFRPYSGLDGHYVRDNCLVRMGDDGLLQLRMATGGVRVEGWALPLNDQVYVIGSEFTSGAMVFALLHGVNATRVEILDGLILAPRLDRGRTVLATTIVLQRVGDLSHDRDADDAALEAMDSKDALVGPDRVPEDVRRHLERQEREGAMKESAGALSVLLSQSMSRGPLPTVS